MPRSKAVASVAAFGVVSGLLWAYIPGRLSELFRGAEQTATVFVAGAATGLLLSFFLLKPLRSARWFEVVLLGVVALAVGGFVFGLIITLLQKAVPASPDVVLKLARYSPFEVGRAYAFAAFGLAPLLLPLAVGTNFLLAWLVRQLWGTRVAA